MPRQDAAADRDRRRAGIALAVVLPALLAGGCGAGTTRPAAAEVVASGPDCLAADVLAELGLPVPDGDTRPGPAPGSVPTGFEPVAVVECRGPLSGPVAIVPEPDVIEIDPVDPQDLLDEEVLLTDPGEWSDAGTGGGLVGIDGPVPGEPGSDEPAATSAPDPAAPGGAPVVQVTEVELRGDLAPLLAQLARPSEELPPDAACPAMWQSRPVIWLVDADGRAVRAAWPTTGCGFLLDDAVTAPLATLEQVSEQVRTAETR